MTVRKRHRESESPVGRCKTPKRTNDLTSKNSMAVTVKEKQRKKTETANMSDEDDQVFQIVVKL